MREVIQHGAMIAQYFHCIGFDDCVTVEYEQYCTARESGLMQASLAVWRLGALTTGVTMFPKSLRKDVIALLCLKAAALTVLYFLFFTPHAAPEPGGDAVRVHLTAAQP
jgi:hypothetical protein